MPSIFVILTSLLISLTLFFRRSNSFLAVFIFFTLAIPESVSIIVNNITFTYIRLASILFTLLSILYFRNFDKKLLVKYVPPFGIIILVKLLSSINSDFSFSEYIPYVIDDLFQTIGLFIIFSAFLNRTDSILQIKRILQSLSILMLISFIFGIVEIAFNKSIYELSGLTELLNERYIGSYYRGTEFRIGSIFANTLLFGYNVVIFTPLLFFHKKMTDKNSLNDYINKILIIVTPLILLGMQSRTCISAYIVFIGIYFSFKYWNKITELKDKKVVYWLLVLTIFSVTINYSAEIFNFANWVLGVSTNAKNDSSLGTRLYQYTFIRNFIENHGFLFGVARINTLKLMDSLDFIAMDSTWIKLFFEGGILAVIVYLFTFWKTIKGLWEKKVIGREPTINRFIITLFFIIVFYVTTFSVFDSIRFEFIMGICIFEIYFKKENTSFSSLKLIELPH